MARRPAHAAHDRTEPSLSPTGYGLRVSTHWLPPGRKSVVPAPADSKVDKWNRWIEGEIRAEVLAMHHQRAVYRRVGEIVNSREPKLPDSLFFPFLANTYAITQATAIRRQAEQSSRVISLGTLLAEIQEEPERLSRQRFVGPWDAEDQKRGQESFSEHFAGDVGDHLDPKIVEADAVRLRDEAQKIVDYVNRHVAHTDKDGLKQLGTFAELHAAIDMIGDLFWKYSLLLTGATYGTLEPVIQTPWEDIFHVPWIVGR
jgi:AbiU2